MTEKDIPEVQISYHRAHQFGLFRKSSFETLLGSGLRPDENGNLMHYGININSLRKPKLEGRMYVNTLESENEANLPVVSYDTIKHLSQVELIITTVYSEASRGEVEQNVLFTPILRNRRIGRKSLPLRKSE